MRSMVNLNVYAFELLETGKKEKGNKKKKALPGLYPHVSPPPVKVKSAIRAAVPLQSLI